MKFFTLLALLAFIIPTILAQSVPVPEGEEPTPSPVDGIPSVSGLPTEPPAVPSPSGDVPVLPTGGAGSPPAGPPPAGPTSGIVTKVSSVARPSPTSANPVVRPTSSTTRSPTPGANGSFKTQVGGAAAAAAVAAWAFLA
ncbi:hypothetical protein HDU85_004378 [Gaertneriomyces sp. JEL0708]|nr:hypothetical protein HDU85_004378 [Gaertneriomyces sp. JEL0708]